MALEEQTTLLFELHKGNLAFLKGEELALPQNSYFSRPDNAWYHNLGHLLVNYAIDTWRNDKQNVHHRAQAELKFLKDGAIVCLGVFPLPKGEVQFAKYETLLQTPVDAGTRDELRLLLGVPSDSTIFLNGSCVCIEYKIRGAEQALIGLRTVASNLYLENVEIRNTERDQLPHG